MIYPYNSFANYSDYSYMMPNVVNPYSMQWPRVSLFPQQARQTPLVDRNKWAARSKSKQQGRRYSNDEPVRKKSDSITEEDIDKTYTGLDREIAEEFISVAMEPKRN